MKTLKNILYIAIFIIALISCNNNSEKAIPEESEKSGGNDIVKLTNNAVKDIGIVISQVNEGEMSWDITAPAIIKPNQDLEAFVGSLVEGRVNVVYVNIGDYVRKGQTLMMIEGLQIGEIKAQFLKAKANLAYAESNYNRLKALIEENVGSQKTFLEAKSDYEKAKAELKAEDNKIHSIGLLDEDVENSNDKHSHTSGLLAVKSPIDGTIVERNVAIGQLVESNSNSFRIINTNSVFADAQIYETDLNRIEGKPEISLKTVAFPGIEFKGKIKYISDIVDKESRTLQIRALINNSDKKLKPEMFAEMKIPTSKSAMALIIPSEAIVNDGNENYVFIAINDSTFEKRIVLIGSSSGEMTEIKSGLIRGDKIVTKGSFMLKSELKKAIFGEE